MSEYVRTIIVSVKIETNKETYVLNLDNHSVGWIEERVTDFLRDHADGLAVGP